MIIEQGVLDSIHCAKRDLDEALKAYENGDLEQFLDIMKCAREDITDALC